MSKKKTKRRSISVKGITYQRITNYCERQDPPESISGYIEGLVAAHLLHREPVPAEVTCKPKPQKEKEEEPIVSSQFTF